jgi:hypothetical protein
MCRLDIVRVVVSPRSSHAFGILVVRNDVVIVREFFVAECAYACLLPNLAVQQLPHLGRRSQLPVSTRMVRILNPLHPKPNDLRLRKEFPTAAGERSVNGTQFICTKSHTIPLKLG